MPIQMFNWISRPQAGFHVAAAATGVILLAMTLLDEWPRHLHPLPNSQGYEVNVAQRSVIMDAMTQAPMPPNVEIDGPVRARVENFSFFYGEKQALPT